MTESRTPAALCLQKAAQGFFWTLVLAGAYILAHVPGAIVELLLG